MTFAVVRGADKVTEPGVYELDDDTYHSDPVPGGSLSHSGSKLLLPPSCPAKFLYEQEHPSPPSDVLDFGKAAHRLVLGTGPEIVEVPHKDWRTNAAKAMKEEAHARGAVPLLTADYDVVQAMATKLSEHPVAMDLFSFGVPEASLFWPDPETGVWRRARTDWLPQESNGRMIIADYKSARSANPRQFAQAAADYGYASQGAWYRDAAIDLQLAEQVAFVFVVQEKTPPYLVSVVELDTEALRIGRALNRRAIDIYRQCTETGEWPGYADDVVLASLPAWYVRQIEQEYAA